MNIHTHGQPLLKRNIPSSFARRLARSWQLYVLLMIPVLYLIIFQYVPMLGIQIAFKKYTIRGGIWGSPWIGLTNFNRFLGSYQFLRVLKNTLFLSFYGLLAGFPLPVLFALSINSITNQRYKKILQMVSYAPHFISITVMVGMLIALFNPRIGLYGVLFEALTGEYPTNLFGISGVFPHLYVWSGIWQNMGWNAIIYIAALSNTDLALHEAAQIDGASRFQRVIHIDLPSILPTMTILLILDAGRMMSVGFEKVYLMQNNLNLSTSEVISTYVYKVGLTSGGDYSLATAIGLFNAIINMLMLVFVNMTARKLSSSSLF